MRFWPSRQQCSNSLLDLTCGCNLRLFGASTRLPWSRRHCRTRPRQRSAIRTCNVTSNPTSSFLSMAPSPTLRGNTLPVMRLQSKRPGTSNDYVLATMRYDKSGEGWGRGDAVWACTSKRGNCTDFHSLFIAMMRSSGIPARFEIGFPLPENKTEGDIAGYHCWAEFYLAGVGWVPVDASAAWKNPAKRDFFFGAHDATRVFFTYGRDIRLSPDQKSEPLNYFIYPYAEANGQPVKNLQTHFSFREISAAQFPAAGH